MLLPALFFWRQTTTTTNNNNNNNNHHNTLLLVVRVALWRCIIRHTPHITHTHAHTRAPSSTRSRNPTSCVGVRASSGLAYPFLRSLSTHHAVARVWCLASGHGAAPQQRKHRKVGTLHRLSRAYCHSLQCKGVWELFCSYFWLLSFGCCCAAASVFADC